MARPRLIDRDAVLDAALQIADANGLDAVTMGAVGRALGVSAMALYRHVGDKSDLLDGLVERLLMELPEAESDVAVPRPAEAVPRTAEQRLVALGEAVRAIAARHPGVFPLLLTRPAATPEARRRRDAVRALLEEMGVPESASARAERLISTLVVGFATSEAAGRFAHHEPAVIDRDWAALGDAVSAIVELSRRSGPDDQGSVQLGSDPN